MKQLSIKRIVEFTLLALLVFGFRVLIQEFMPLFEENLNLTFGRFLIKLLSNYPLTLVMLFIDISMVVVLNRYVKDDWTFLKIFLIVVSSVVIAFLSALWIRVPIWNDVYGATFFKDIFFNLTLFSSFVFNLIVISLLHVYSYYSRKQEKALNLEIGKKNRARYQYQQLKNQLNPHFLFNSLNVLDYLIYTDQQRASDFVRKLSSVYRYLLRKEDLPVVTIREEVDFVNLYVDLLRERFSDGLSIEIRIDKEFEDYCIVPGGLQMLVENAIKHNIISVETPLKIEVYIENNMIAVRNNLQLRFTTIDSSGVGLSNIKGQYMFLFRKNIKIISSENYFEVQLPLIDKS
ncbi:MAG: histidine kinase [Bacteroidetes bacterium HGW-Bacteroidetes-10]|nr:MAG: histidine kinase [Bacteroidetes bacterium HGW-Bacteroidetes-10]